MSSRLLNERASFITKWLDELDHDDEFMERVHKTLLVNFQHVRRGALNEVRAILDEAIRKDYAGNVNAVLYSIKRKVDSL
ncbi:MAG: hypothetical protein PVI03_05160 [Candidatus Thorarchaeota archaeon]|jgi:hypothetical protein